MTATFIMVKIAMDLSVSCKFNGGVTCEDDGHTARLKCSGGVMAFLEV